MMIFLKNKFPSLNEALAAAKSHWAVYAKMKKNQTAIVANALRAEKVRPFMIPPSLVITFIEPEKGRKRDWDNITFATKFILDGMVEAGVLQDDSPEFIRSVKTIVSYSDSYGVLIENE